MASKNPKFNVTLSLDKELYKKIKTNADEHNISLNLLANKIFEDFIQWDVNANKVGWAVLPKFTVTGLINQLENKSIVNLARNLADSYKEIIFMMTGRDDLKGFLSILKNRSAKSGFIFTARKQNKFYSYMVQHDMGKKWSIFLATLHEETLKMMGHTPVVTHTNNAFVILLK